MMRRHGLQKMIRGAAMRYEDLPAGTKRVEERFVDACFAPLRCREHSAEPATAAGSSLKNHVVAARYAVWHERSTET